MPGGPAFNATAVQALWTTAKAQLATVQADAATPAADFGNLEASCDALYNLGARDLVDWDCNVCQKPSKNAIM